MDFLQVLKALTERDLKFVIVGGVAARLYGSTRLTHDIDIVPQLDADTWPQMIELIEISGGKPRIPESFESIKNLKNIHRWVSEKGMLALSFRSDDGAMEVDLLVSGTPGYEKLKTQARSVEVDDKVFWIASIEDLIEMKKTAGRPQDLLDIKVLEKLRQNTVEP